MEPARSHHWPTVMHAHLLAQPAAVCCGVKEKLNVHHLYPFHYCLACGRPDLELDQRNLVTVDEAEATEHHLLLGHLGNFQSFNPDALTDLKMFGHMYAVEIKADKNWIAKCAHRPALVAHTDLYALRRHLDLVLPSDPQVLLKFSLVIEPFKQAA